MTYPLCYGALQYSNFSLFWDSLSSLQSQSFPIWFKINKKDWKQQKKVFPPALWCVQHPKAGWNTQHICIAFQPTWLGETCSPWMYYTGEHELKFSLCDGDVMTMFKTERLPGQSASAKHSWHQTQKKNIQDFSTKKPNFFKTLTFKTS